MLLMASPELAVKIMLVNLYLVACSHCVRFLPLLFVDPVKQKILLFGDIRRPARCTAVLS